MNLTEIASRRYSTKAFDPTKKISDEQFEQILDLLRLSPSSVNSQPWHFIIAKDDAGKQRLAKSTQGEFAFNEPKVMSASHVILCCAKTQIDDDYLAHLLETEEKDGRFADPAVKEMVQAGRNKFVNLHRNELGDVEHWMQKQVYLNMGTVLLGAATLGLDALPMEGIDLAALDKEFDLPGKGLKAVALIALGYHSDADFNATLPKSRLPQDEIITIL